MAGKKFPHRGNRFYSNRTRDSERSRKTSSPLTPAASEAQAFLQLRQLSNKRSWVRYLPSGLSEVLLELLGHGRVDVLVALSTSYPGKKQEY